MDKHTDPEIQFQGNIRGDYPNYFEDCGWNYYTKDSLLLIIRELKEVLKDPIKQQAVRNDFQDEKLAKEELEFYERLVVKLQDVLSAAEDYEYILFLGP